MRRKGIEVMKISKISRSIRMCTTFCLIPGYISFCLVIYLQIVQYDKICPAEKNSYTMVERNTYSQNKTGDWFVLKCQSQRMILNYSTKPQPRTSPEGRAGRAEYNKAKGDGRKMRIAHNNSQDNDANGHTLRLHNTNNYGKRIILPYDFNWTINEPFKCHNIDGSNREVYFLVLITSVHAHVSKRNAIRKTWGSPKEIHDRKIVTLFLLAKNTEIKKQLLIEKESKHYKDMLMGDFMDTYKNLTLKTLMGIKWATSFCPHVKYIMKTDDDMYVNYGNMIMHLSDPKTPTSNYVFGDVRNAKPIRNPRSKNYMPFEEYPGEKYPPFCSGTGYVFSGDVALKVYKAAHNIPFIYLEDVFFGICLLSLQIKPVTHEGFYTKRTSYSYCKYKKSFTIHYVNPEQMQKIWVDQKTLKGYKCD
nr:beta-1,3-galactosyltransferase 1-like [Lytechinus pictus]